MNKYRLMERAYLGAMSAVLRRSMYVPPMRSFHRMFPAEVTSITRIAPRVRRITLAGDGISQWQLLGPDEYFGLYMPPDGVELTLPERGSLNPRSELATLDELVRPDLRWYTVRSHRPHLGEIDADIVVHHDGPGERFLQRVVPGQQVGIREGGAAFAVHDGPMLLVGDETASPAISAILESTPASSDIRAFIEAPSHDYIVPTDASIQPELIWRGDRAPGQALGDALASAITGPVAFAWLAGEQTLVRDARRHVIEHGTDKRSVTHAAYWIMGRPRP